MKHFFVSYNQADRGWAEWIAWQLEEADYTTVIQAWDFKAGGNFVLDMQQAAIEAERTIAVLSPEYLDSGFTQPEWAAAFAQDPKGEQSKLLPVRVRECTLTGILATIQYIDLVGYEEEEARDLLLADIKPGRLKPAIRPDYPGPTERTETPRPGFPGHSSELLDSYEQAYRQRLKARFEKEAPYYVPLSGETTETIAPPVDAKAPRSALRRKLRAGAEYHEWIQVDQEIQQVKLETLRAGVDRYPCLILLGDPGSGKTTALHNLAYEFAAETDKLPLPLYLSEFQPEMTLKQFIVQGWAGHLSTNHWAAPELAANLERYLEEGKLLLLFDALNEMPREGYSQRTQELRQFIDDWSTSGNHFLVTCRVLDYGEELAGLQRVEVQPLNDEQIQTFLHNELPQDHHTLWQSLTASGDGPSRLLEMARNPYLLTMMIDIFAENGRLGQNRAEMMENFTQILFEWAKTKCPPGEWLDSEIQREALSVLAFETQTRVGFGTMVKLEQVKAVMPQQVRPDPDWPAVSSPPDQVLKLASSANIIEADRASVRFYHQLLQEYFAARHLLKQDLTVLTDLWRWPWLEIEMPLWVRPENSLDRLPPPPPTGWEETTILAAGLAAENDDHVIRALIPVNPVLAGRCLHDGQARVKRSTRQAVIEALLATISDSQVALRVRIAAGEVLGYLGDPRLGEMVTVPAGKFVMGDDQGQYGDEMPQHKLFLPEYRIGKYPITNFEFGRFIQSGGYQRKRWWTETGWQKKEVEEWNKPRFWRDSRFNNPNQPVVGISWFETVAYCRWLSTETGQNYRLPTEAEWEKAARGADGRQYPWGNEFEASRLNAYDGEQQIRTTTPVGIYPLGISPFNVFDCAGNVWEWCATQGGKSYPYDVEQDEWSASYLEGTEVRVLRGGSWFADQEDARCAFRGDVDLLPLTRDFNGGFRVVSPV